MRGAIHSGLARTRLLPLLVVLRTHAALAHTGSAEATGFLTGLRHPVSGLDHILAMVAVGLWGAPPSRWSWPLAGRSV